MRKKFLIAVLAVIATFSLVSCVNDTEPTEKVKTTSATDEETTQVDTTSATEEETTQVDTTSATDEETTQVDTTSVTDEDTTNSTQEINTETASEGEHNSNVTGWWKRPDRENNMELATIYYIDMDTNNVTTYDINGTEFSKYEITSDGNNFILKTGDLYGDITLTYDGNNLLQDGGGVYLESCSENPIQN